MTEAAKMRMERIERLLSELEYEIVRGVMEREIEPDLHLSKIFPCSGRGDGTALMELHVYPGSKHFGSTNQYRRGPKLRVIDGADQNGNGTRISEHASEQGKAYSEQSAV